MPSATTRRLLKRIPWIALIDEKGRPLAAAHVCHTETAGLQGALVTSCPDTWNEIPSNGWRRESISQFRAIAEYLSYHDVKIRQNILFLSQ